MTSATVAAIATMLTLRTLERGVAGGALARIRSVGIVCNILFVADRNDFIQRQWVVRLLQQMAIAQQRAPRVDRALRAERRADTRDDVAELASQNR
ncbi:hypothetical protein EI171_29580 [Bradyrhizobium sp. LCT2]|nr:hypothetical protein EI171_29580 [Bradyrhizobium sp. LCT2]